MLKPPSLKQTSWPLRILIILSMVFAMLFMVTTTAGFTVFLVGEHIADTAEASTDSTFVPQESDIIVSFAGNILRHWYAETLYKKSGCHWVISDPRDTIYKYVKLEVPDSTTMTPVYSGISTYTEITGIDSALATFVESRKKRYPDQRIIFISSPSHLARIKLMAERHVDVDDTKFLYLGLHQGYMAFTPEYYHYWWRQWLLRGELKKYLGYWVLYWF
ncbi:MAG: YdcF family protein [Fibrobacterales bacterium]